MGSAGTSRLHPFTDEWPGFNPVGASVSGKPLSSGVRCGVPLTNGSEFQMIVGWGVDRVAGTFLLFGTLHGLASMPLIRRCCNQREFLAAALGFAVMAVVAVWT